MNHAVSITFGMSAQGVLAELGTPNYASYRRDEAMRIHNTPRDESRNDGTVAEDHWWKYVSLGVDVLFDGYSHTAKSLCSGHPDFKRYRRCNFSIVLPFGEGRIDALSKVCISTLTFTTISLVGRHQESGWEIRQKNMLSSTRLIFDVGRWSQYHT
ncbi:hypothetical protein BJ742DRAFT_806047 [Cladochytrium replicatum]|nr:hypothetical protein BJ742DRAFT_806047 [Cladochytrium replicatum]